MGKGASSGSREPNPQAVSALSGFDPARFDDLCASVSAALADKVFKTLGALEGYTPPETPQDWDCLAAGQTIRALCSILRHERTDDTLDKLAPRIEGGRRQDGNPQGAAQ